MSVISHLFYFEQQGNKGGIPLSPFWVRTVPPGAHWMDGTKVALGTLEMLSPPGQTAGFLYSVNALN